MSELHDFVQLPAEGKATPTNYVTAGALTTVSSPQYLGAPLTASLATAAGPFVAASYEYAVQDNSAPNQYLSNYPWLTTVTGPIYNSPGGILNKAPGYTTTGGGP